MKKSKMIMQEHKEKKKSVKEVIASITIKQPITTLPPPSVTKKTPKKSYATISRVSSKRKWA